MIYNSWFADNLFILQSKYNVRFKKKYTIIVTIRSKSLSIWIKLRYN